MARKELSYHISRPFPILSNLPIIGIRVVQSIGMDFHNVVLWRGNNQYRIMLPCRKIDKYTIF
jgi:hypothetical protein